MEQEIQSRLRALQDPTYRDFQCQLMPTVDPQTVLGVRIPSLRSLAKKLVATHSAAEFCRHLPHQYYDENNLHGLLISQIRDYDLCLAAVNAFLPYVNNWATCDLLSPKVFKKHLPTLLTEIRSWLAADHAYTVRFGLKILMSFYLNDDFCPEYLELASSVHSEEYYVKMMAAWFFATALAKQYEATLPYLQQRRLQQWTHNKTIQKAVESRRLSEEHKAVLRTYKIK